MKMSSLTSQADLSSKPPVLLDRYSRSASALKRALSVIPIGSQTFSKSHLQYPQASPQFVTRGSGSHVWDVDENEYIDLVAGLLSVSLGYCHPEVDDAVRTQLGRGVTFSLSTELEAELAETLQRLIPCAEAVRFAKNGTDATSAAVRVARSVTGRDLILHCGYHGWQDWSIATTTRNGGIPIAVQRLSYSFTFNDVHSLEVLFDEFRGQIAAVVMEPMNSQYPAEGFLESTRNLCTAEGALLVFDETITGFRFGLQGAQGLFGVTPDLATFGKGMANGFPISAVVGSQSLMAEMEKIFFSGTFGGESLSLAASLATIRVFERENVADSLAIIGQIFRSISDKNFASVGLGHVLKLVGHPSWAIYQFVDHLGCTALELKSLYLQEMLRHGVLVNSSHNVMLAHSSEDAEIFARAQRHAVNTLGEAVAAGSVSRFLVGPPIQPIFRVR
jgi:glutamate-1-semialdehyde 2,1-aminomutase